MSISSILFKQAFSKWAYHLSTLGKNQERESDKLSHYVRLCITSFLILQFQVLPVITQESQVTIFVPDYTLAPSKIFSHSKAKFVLNIEGESLWFCRFQIPSPGCNLCEDIVIAKWIHTKIERVITELFSCQALEFIVVLSYLSLTTVLEAAK